MRAALLPAASHPHSNPLCSRCLPLSPTATQQNLTSRTAAASVGASQGSSCHGCCTWGPLGVEACTGTQTHLSSQQKAMARPCQLFQGGRCPVQSSSQSKHEPATLVSFVTTVQAPNAVHWQRPPPLTLPDVCGSAPRRCAAVQVLMHHLHGVPACLPAGFQRYLCTLMQLRQTRQEGRLAPHRPAASAVWVSKGGHSA